jgi:hypothetical protein
MILKIVLKTDGIEKYWQSIYNLINCIQTDLVDNNYMVTINNFTAGTILNDTILHQNNRRY